MSTVYNFDDFPIGAFRRVPFAPDSTDFVGMTWPSSGDDAAVWLMQIRLRPGRDDAPLISLSNAPERSQGLFATISEDDGIPVTHLFPFISEATMEALPWPHPSACTLELYYDIHVTPADDVKRLVLAGPFIVKPGVTM